MTPIERYNRCRWHINQIDCLQSCFGNENRYDKLILRLRCIVAGLMIDRPHWTSLITFDKEMTE